MDFNMEPYVRYIAKTSYFITNKIVSNDCRIIYIVSGKGSFISGDKAYPLSAGTFVYYPYGVPYRVESYENRLLFYTVNFDFDFKNTSVTTMMPKEAHIHKSENEFKSVRDEWKQFLEVIHLENAFWAEEILECVYNEAVNKNVGYDRMQSAFMRRLLIEIYRRVCNSKHKNPLCERIKELVAKNLKYNNKQLAEELNYHPFYLNEIMQKCEGVSLHKYIISQRLKKAYEQITTSGDSLEIIAINCGFSSQSHLSTAFRTEYNVLPSVLRRQI